MIKYELKRKGNSNNFFMSANMEDIHNQIRDIKKALNEKVELYILKSLETGSLKLLVTMVQKELRFRNDMRRFEEDNNK